MRSLPSRRLIVASRKSTVLVRPQSVLTKIHCLDLVDYTLGGGRAVKKRQEDVDLVAGGNIHVVWGACRATNNGRLGHAVAHVIFFD